MKLKSKLITLTISALLSASAMTVHAAGSTASTRASNDFAAAAGSVVVGSVGMLGASSELIVLGVEHSARGVSVVVKGSADASGEVVTLLLDGATAASVAVGSVLQASATAAGYVLIAAGKAVAFIPNEIGRSLLHQSRYSR